MWRGGAWVMRMSVVEGMEDQMDRPFGSEREEGEALVGVVEGTSCGAIGEQGQR